jgi:uncharacterized protein YodC (DUF2158 family)
MAWNFGGGPVIIRRPSSRWLSYLCHWLEGLWPQRRSDRCSYEEGALPPSSGSSDGVIKAR